MIKSVVKFARKKIKDERLGKTKRSPLFMLFYDQELEAQFVQKFYFTNYSGWCSRQFFLRVPIIEVLAVLVYFIVPFQVYGDRIYEEYLAIMYQCCSIIFLGLIAYGIYLSFAKKKYIYKNIVFYECVCVLAYSVVLCVTIFHESMHDYYVGLFLIHFTFQIAWRLRFFFMAIIALISFVIHGVVKLIVGYAAYPKMGKDAHIWFYIVYHFVLCAVVLIVLNGLEKFERDTFIKLKNITVVSKQLKNKRATLKVLMDNVVPRDFTRGMSRSLRKDRNKLIVSEKRNCLVLLAGLQNFSEFCTAASHIDLVKYLDTLFKSFDCMTRNLKITKVKSIGDLVLCTKYEGKAHFENGFKDCIVCGLTFILLSRLINETLSQHTSTVGTPKVKVGISFDHVIFSFYRENYSFDIYGKAFKTAVKLQKICPADSVMVSNKVFENTLNDFRFKNEVGGENADVHYVKYDEGEEEEITPDERVRQILKALNENRRKLSNVEELEFKSGDEVGHRSGASVLLLPKKTKGARERVFDKLKEESNIEYYIENGNSDEEPKKIQILERGRKSNKRGGGKSTTRNVYPASVSSTGSTSSYFTSSQRSWSDNSSYNYSYSTSTTGSLYMYSKSSQSGQTESTYITNEEEAISSSQYTTTSNATTPTPSLKKVTNSLREKLQKKLKKYRLQIRTNETLTTVSLSERNTTTTNSSKSLSTPKNHLRIRTREKPNFFAIFKKNIFLSRHGLFYLCMCFRSLKKEKKFAEDTHKVKQWIQIVGLMSLFVFSSVFYGLAPSYFDWNQLKQLSQYFVLFPTLISFVLILLELANIFRYSACTVSSTSLPSSHHRSHKPKDSQTVSRLISNCIMILAMASSVPFLFLFNKYWNRYYYQTNEWYFEFDFNTFSLWISFSTVCTMFLYSQNMFFFTTCIFVWVLCIGFAALIEVDYSLEKLFVGWLGLVVDVFVSSVGAWISRAQLEMVLRRHWEHKVECKAKNKQLNREIDEINKIIEIILPISVIDRLLKDEAIVDYYSRSFSCFLKFWEIKDFTIPTIEFCVKVFELFDEFLYSADCMKIKSINETYFFIRILQNDESYEQSLFDILEAIRLCIIIFIREITLTNVNILGLKIGLSFGQVTCGLFGYEKLVYDCIGKSVNNSFHLMNSATKLNAIHFISEYLPRMNQMEMVYIGHLETIKLKGEEKEKTSLYAEFLEIDSDEPGFDSDEEDIFEVPILHNY